MGSEAPEAWKTFAAQLSAKGINPDAIVDAKELDKLYKELCPTASVVPRLQVRSYFMSRFVSPRSAVNPESITPLPSTAADPTDVETEAFRVRIESQRREFAEMMRCVSPRPDSERLVILAVEAAESKDIHEAIALALDAYHSDSAFVPALLLLCGLRFWRPSAFRSSGFSVEAALYTAKRVPRARLAWSQRFCEALCAPGSATATRVWLNGMLRPFVDPSLQESLRLYRVAAEMGSVVAQYSLAGYLANGNGIPKDYTESVRLWKLAGTQGHATALHLLAFSFKRGEGVQKDDQEALRLWRLAAERGSPDAQYSLGLAYRSGDIVEKDSARAVALFRSASEMALADATYRLAECYMRGDGVQKDAAEAVWLWRGAADKNHTDSLVGLAIAYHNGEGTAKDLAEAARLWKLAADKGSPDGQSYLAMCYLNGEGVPKDPAEAVRLWKIAAGQGHADAQCNLGLCYHIGEGAAKDLEAAAACYELAANQGYGAALYGLGLCYFKGEGVQKDVKEAIRLLCLAAGRGNKEAQEAVSMILGNLQYTS